MITLKFTTILINMTLHTLQRYFSFVRFSLNIIINNVFFGSGERVVLCLQISFRKYATNFQYIFSVFILQKLLFFSETLLPLLISTRGRFSDRVQSSTPAHAAVPTPPRPNPAVRVYAVELYTVRSFPVVVV